MNHLNFLNAVGRRLPCFVVFAVVFQAHFPSAKYEWAQDTHGAVDAEVRIQVRRLNDNNPGVRQAAALALGQVGPDARSAVLGLITKLTDRDASVRSAAADALARIGPEAKVALPALISTLQDKNPRVRAAATWAIGKMGPDARVAVPALVERLNDNDARVISAAAWALGTLGPEASAAAPALVRVLRDEDPVVRDPAAWALGQIRPDARIAVPALTGTLADANPKVRGSAAWALGELGPEATTAASPLIGMLKDTDPTVREKAAWALGQIGPDARASIPALINALRDREGVVHQLAAGALVYLGAAAVPGLRDALKDRDPNVRWATAGILAQIGPDARVAAPSLADVLKDTDSNVRGAAAWALGQIGSDSKVAVSGLIDALKDSDATVQGNVAWALGQIGPDSKAAVPGLIAVLNSSDPKARANAAGALGQIGLEAKAAVPALLPILQDKDRSSRAAAAEALFKIADALRQANRTDAIEQLNQASAALKANADPDIKKRADLVQGDVEFLEILQSSSGKEVLRRFTREHPYVILITGAYLLAGVACSILFWRFPLTLFEIDEALTPYSDFELPEWLGKLKVPLSRLILVGFFHYHPRVLDAWVAQYAASARDSFSRIRTVSDREVHIEVPTVLDGKSIAGLTVERLRPIFARRKLCVLIVGEGGSGKTSLACQLARWGMEEDKRVRLCDHLMLPILLEEDFAHEPDTEHEALAKAVRDGLSTLISAALTLSSELVAQLLRQRRLLVIVDGLSEKGERTRASIRPGSADFLANSLVITSRTEEKLEGIPRTTIMPIRIQGNRLSSFMEAYLIQRGKKGLFEDPEYFEALRKLSLMVGERDITVLLAKLYAEQMIATKETSPGGRLPQNIPDLMLEYVNELNRQVEDRKLDDRTVHRVAKVTAWECLKQTYRPTPASINGVWTALGGRAGTAEGHLQYLENRLRLVQTIGAGRDRVRFTLDPLAEYLAGLHLVELYAGREQLWRQFLTEIDGRPGATETIKGFLVAVRDCCLIRAPEANLLDSVAQELTKRIAPDFVRPMEAVCPQNPIGSHNQ